MPTAAENVDQSITDLTVLIATKTAEFIAAGMPPTFSLDGLSIDWASWLKAMNDNLKALIELRAALQGPFMINTRLRS